MKPSVGRKAVKAAMMAAMMVVVTSVAWSAVPFALRSLTSVTASSASRRPIKGILKNKRSTVSSVVVSIQQSRGVIPEVQRKKTQKWDQLNILATSHPAYRNYDFMKINEPSSHHLGRADDEDLVNDPEGKEAMTPDISAKKPAATDTSEFIHQVGEPENDGAHGSRIFLNRHVKQQKFTLKRKLHYNKGLNIKVSRKMISKDFLYDDDEETPPSNHEASTATEDSHEGSTTDEPQTHSCHA
ncbi:protein phosphatase inhibitor 2 family member C [Lynx canadensis]|uniref:protein phosphatase inhibitor 2 family member C n=1 Tax=Lynx canadensis TaxID=61383 RepID=UPI0011AFFC35|nr:protein phosphatase inhibitor 2 family member C [Lynx canadensis]